MLVVNKLNKKYYKKVINNFSYTFKKGMIYSITGPSGCGKSTLLSILSGSYKSYSGAVYYKNVNIKKLKNYSFINVGYVYQSYQLFDNLTALENVLLPYEMQNKKIDNLKYKINTLFNKFKISHVINQKVNKLSGGEKQKVAIIRAIIKNPDILLLDEPTSALDETSSEILLDYLQFLKKDRIIIMVTHNDKLAMMCDEIIDFRSLTRKNNEQIKEVNVKEEDIKFHKLSWLHKKVFTTKKIFNYLASSILSLGIIGICLSNILSSFIRNVVDQSFSLFNNENNVTFKALDNNETIDFNNEISEDYQSIFYEGIESNYKKQIKDNCKIKRVYFNNYEVIDYLFIFDNYLSTFEENLVVYIPAHLSNELLKNNYFNIALNNYSFKISIDKVIINEEDEFLIFCNNINYLKPYFDYLGIECEKTSLFYSNKADELYDYLLSNEKYSNYNFTLDINNNIIYILKSYFVKVDENSLIEFLNNNPYEYYLISDYKHTLIDYDTGFIYLLLDNNEAIQVIIDNSLTNDSINISNKLFQKYKKSDSLMLFNEEYKINKITIENNYSIIYMNHETFNDLNDKNIYSGLIHLKNNEVVFIDKILVNTHLFEKKSFKVFDYICDFLSLFSLILIIEAIIASLIIFTITFINKKKEMICLIKLGVYKSKVVTLLLIDPIKNITSSLISSLISVFICKFMVSFIYYQIQQVSIEVSFSLTLIISILSIPFLVILPLIYFKLKKFLKKYFEK